MIRVTRTEEHSRTVVTVDGELSSDTTGVVDAICSQAKSNGTQVVLYLRDVTTVDQAGQVLLRRLAGKGVTLLGNGVYTSYLVQSLGSNIEVGRTSHGVGSTRA